ncbi:hypothetical protein [Mycolicibacterium llatzerense]|uniref:hypothetical protein n=1 Tax=Mycolicibacterium llatzerense TaxID=280871 RepID=UPI0008DE5D48|nr:hypothetical protein [Mycolicibacterium llatzerense]
MAFIEPTPEQITRAEQALLPHYLKGLVAARGKQVAKINEVADARFHAGPDDPPLWETTFKAVAYYRKNRETLRDWMDTTAAVAIMASAPSGPTCDRLGIGRATMQRVMAASPQLAMLTDVKPKGESNGTAA